MHHFVSLKARIDNPETSTETLAPGTINVVTATELRGDAGEHLQALREKLDIGGGENTEVDSE